MGSVVLISLITIYVLLFTSMAIFIVGWMDIDLGLPSDSPAAMNLMGWYTVVAAIMTIPLTIGIAWDVGSRKANLARQKSKN
jgi:hypothetical protein